MNHPYKKINKETLELNHILDQLDFTDIYRLFHPTAAEYTFLSSTHETFSRIEHMIGHKINLSKLKTEIIPTIFSDHNGYETRNQQQEKSWKIYKYVEMNNTLLNK